MRIQPAKSPSPIIQIRTRRALFRHKAEWKEDLWANAAPQQMLMERAKVRGKIKYIMHNRQGLRYFHKWIRSSPKKDKNHKTQRLLLGTQQLTWTRKTIWNATTSKAKLKKVKLTNRYWLRNFHNHNLWLILKLHHIWRSKREWRKKFKVICL